MLQIHPSFTHSSVTQAEHLCVHHHVHVLHLVQDIANDLNIPGTIAAYSILLVSPASKIAASNTAASRTAQACLVQLQLLSCSLV